MAARTGPTSRQFERSLVRALRAPARDQTYRNLCYLLVMFPLSVGYFVLLTVGFSTGVPLIPVLVGVPIIVLTLVAVVEIARFERFLVRVLLGVHVSPSSVEPAGGLWSRTKALVFDLGTWKAVAYLLSEFVYSTVVIWLLASLSGTTASFLLAPLYYEHAPVVAYGTIPTTDFTLDVLFGWDDLLVGLTATFQLGSWQVETLPGALFFAGLGVVSLFFLFQLVNGFARIWGRYAAFMLTAPRYWTAPKR